MSIGVGPVSDTLISWLRGDADRTVEGEAAWDATDKVIGGLAEG